MEVGEGKTSDWEEVELVGVVGSINSPPAGQNGCHFADDSFNEKFCISIQISLRYIGKSPTDNKAALVQVMAWRWTGDKPLSEPMLP